MKTKITIKPVSFKNSSTVAFVDLELDECLVVKGITLIEGRDPGNYFLGFPSKKGKDKDGNEKYFNTVYPITKEYRENLTKVVLKKYKEVSKKTKESEFN